MLSGRKEVSWEDYRRYILKYDEKGRGEGIGCKMKITARNAPIMPASGCREGMTCP